MPLQVIGAGLGRTGTMSLKLALEDLGFRKCYHMSEVLANPPCVAQWIAAGQGRPDWEKVFAGYTATTDYPACTYWRELTAAYPDAKVILTVRDPNDWFDSTQATIFSPQMRGKITLSPLGPFFDRSVWGSFGQRIDDRGHMVAAFENHNAEVRRGVPAARLLELEVKQGWAPLCEFLGVPQPERPFPRVNSREEMAALVAAIGAGPVDPAEIGKMALQKLERLRTP